MSNKLILELTTLVGQIRYENNRAEKGTKKDKSEAAKELLHLSTMAKHIFKQNNILKIVHPHIPEENYDLWYAEMGMGRGLIHDIDIAILKLKENLIDNIEDFSKNNDEGEEKLNENI